MNYRVPDRMKIEHIEADEAGFPARIRVSDEGDSVEIVPGAGMGIVSLVFQGQEHLAMPLPLNEFMRSPHTGGIPFLYPWANRLRSDQYSFEEERVDLSGIEGLKRDDAGHPMHGVILRFNKWVINSYMDGDKAVVEGVVDWGSHPELMRAFPFPHRLTIQWSVQKVNTECVITSMMKVETSGEDVPIVAGWHPYFSPPVSDRAQLVLKGPDMAEIALDDLGLPLLTEHSVEVGAAKSLNGPLGTRTFDDLFEAPLSGFEWVIQGETTEILIMGGAEWGALQLYTPSDGCFVCVEPMVARTAALSDDDHMMIATQEAPVETTYTIAVRQKSI